MASMDSLITATDEECIRLHGVSCRYFLHQLPSLDVVEHGSSHSLTIATITSASRQQELLHFSINPQVYKEDKVWYGVEYMLKIAHLSAFGILGVLIRFALGVYFGDILPITDNYIPLYKDLPANLVGSFMMGWLGIVWREDISKLFSEHVAMGLTTGLLGSMTTFSSWNQRMVELVTLGKWPYALLGYIIGMGLLQMSLLSGIKTGRALKGLATYYYYGHTNSIIVENMRVKKRLWKINSYCKMHYMIIHLVGLLMGVSAWIGAVLLTLIDDDNRRSSVWVACVIAPIGVWLRWYFEDFNGKAFFTSQMQWFPMGTFLTNLIATSLDAALGAALLLVKDPNLILLSRSFQLGFTGCVSSVSAFVAEIHMTYVEYSTKRAFTYALATLVFAMLLGMSIYSIHVWVEGW